MVKVLSCLFFLTMSSLALASVDARPVVRDIGVSKGKDDLSIGGILNFQGIELEETQYFNGEMSTSLEKANTDEQYKLLQSAFESQKDYEVQAKSSILNKARYIQNHPEEYVDWISGGQSDCEESDKEDLITKQTKVCDEFHQLTTNQCLVGRKIKIEGAHTYECNKERIVEKKSCFNQLSVTCKKGQDCDSKGVILTSIASDMKWKYSYPYLTIGTISNNYWHAWCGKFVRNTKFMVKNKEAIDELSIVELGFDDYMRILINGVQVYNGPKGGDRLETTGRGTVYTSSENQYNCELYTNWRFNTNIDLLPFIKEGENEITMEVVVGGAGEGWMKIKTMQHCCIEEESWEEICPE